MKRVILSMLVLLPSLSFGQCVTIENDAYRSVYDLSLQCPMQVIWTLHRTDVGDIKREPSWRFTADIDSPLAVARHADYNHSGYHRGHLCPAADRSAVAQLMRQTFALSNVAPQLAQVNVGSWKRTENQTRNYLHDHDSVRVLVMPVFLPEDTLYIGKGHLAVPHAFFKAVWLPANDSVLSAWFVFNR